MIASLTLATGYAVPATTSNSMELLGYYENWNTVKWWDNDIPGNCAMGCAVPQAFMEQLAPYSSLNYGFTFLVETPNPDQVECTTPSTCPLWDGGGIYIAAKSKSGATVVDASTTAADLTPGLVGVGEACRLARMAPSSGPHRCKISLGGWSDWARLGSAAAAKQVAALASKLVLYSFADGVDLDFEHLTPFDAQFGGEMEAYVTLVTELRAALADAAKGWGAAVDARAAKLTTMNASVPSWQKRDYYTTNLKYLAELKANGAPTLELSYTTRFNAFLPDPTGDPWNYLLPSSPVPNSTFATDNEGGKLWAKIGSAVDSVNVMAYDAGTDAGPLQLNFTTIASNFIAGGVPASKLYLGFEPGEQAGGGAWEGQDADLKWAADAKAAGLAGTFVWAINPDAGSAGAAAAPKLAAALKQATGAGWPARFGPPPTYSKVDAATGWLP